MGKKMNSSGIIDTVDRASSFVDKKIEKINIRRGSKFTFLLITLILLLLSLSFVVWKGLISTGVKSALKQYDFSLSESEKKARENIYSEAYEKALKKYQATNELQINVTRIQSATNYQIYSVLERVIETQTPEEKKKYNIECWFSYEGLGTYSVNLQIGEYIVDQERHYVMARIPRPELSIIYTDEDLLINKDRTLIKNGNSKDGTELSIALRERGKAEIREKIESNLEYYNNAEIAAKKQVEQLIRMFNHGIDDLKVDVFFLDE